MKRAARGNLACRGCANAVNAVILNGAGRNLGELHLAEERDQADAVPFNPFRAELTFRDDGIFLLELLGGLGKGLFGFQQPGRQLATQPKIPVLRKGLGLLQSSFLGAGTVLLTFYRRRAMPGEAPASVDIDLPSEDFMARHTGPLFVSHFDMGTGNHDLKGPVKSAPGFVLALC